MTEFFPPLCASSESGYEVADTVAARAVWPLQVQLAYTEPGTARVWLHGAFDIANTDRVGELLQSRLRSSLQRVVLDLSGLEFLSVSAVRVLATVAVSAERYGTELLVVASTSRSVRAALRAADCAHYLPLVTEHL